MIKEYRQKNGFSQEELAEKIDISWRHLQRLEHNESKTTVKTLKKLIKVLKISDKDILDYLKNNTNSVQDVAIITDGNPLMIEGPCCVDPNAIVAWTGRKPEVKVAQLSWKTFIGQTSGESYHLQFNEPGQLVIIQPSERLSGLNVSID